ncbi:hypothetical protein F5B22DRAFT_70670 [Xylaria bambusicola]|uniref:uncharacterized protein n=1 Tax=Xylaria bambusicola TaxID=326684 RepID=UPI0020080795|nr:uncharacterized protein F5B22DRAFT_70670 [Xylaria bambusicola]KAI0518558.1 hypothetical protein F5B22DRAFT_70670 [Xylaria bambusicola]
MSTVGELLQRYEGHIVPRSFNAGFVGLSYVVSFIGAVSTLELINRRTSRNGVLNHIYLVTAAVAMGGISIWSMHYVGNRAIVLAQDQYELQIVYSSKFTAISFFIPIFVLLAAFVAIGTNSLVSFWRLGVGGTLAGGAICGMHYLGNASIENYRCQYDTVNVVGSAIIAVVASNAALAFFFLWRASWKNSWWKRGISGAVLAGAVSGMHWCASTGTNYRLVKLNMGNEFSRNTVVIFVTVLSFSAALIVAGVVGHGAWVARSNASKSRHVVLAAAIFDRNGRILVSPDGLLPSEKITDTYIEKTPSDTFSIENPLFQWMFQASRNWDATSGMITTMANHLARQSGNSRGRNVGLISENGQLIENYDVVFRELFCLAAASLASRLKKQLTDVGVLWDEILPTGDVRTRHSKENPSDSSERGESMEMNQSQSGRGSLMFLVRRLEHSSDVEKLEAAGFRFADIHQVSSIIRHGMKIKAVDLSHTLTEMATYAEQPMADAGVHLGFFGIRARVSGFGFDVLVERGARNVLPSSKIPLDRLEPWHAEFLNKHYGLNVPSLLRTLRDPSKRRTDKEAEFASVLADAITTLCIRVDNRRIFDEATLSYRTVQVPCEPRPESTGMEECTMIVLHSVVPIHYSLSSLRGPGCEFIPLSFFKVQQMVHKNSPYQAAFTQHLHRELVPIIKGVSVSAHKPNLQQAPQGRQRDWRSGFRKVGRKADFRATDAEGNPIPTKLGSKSSSSSSGQSSTLKLWDREESNMKTASLDTPPDKPTSMARGVRNVSSLGGILVSQEIRVAVSQVKEVDGRSSDVGSPPLDQTPPNPPGVVGSYPAHSSHTRSRTNTSTHIELQPLPRAHADGGVKQGLGLTAEASRSASEVKTFVDEMFSACFERR